MGDPDRDGSHVYGQRMWQCPKCPCEWPSQLAAAECCDPVWLAAEDPEIRHRSRRQMSADGRDDDLVDEPRGRVRHR